MVQRKGWKKVRLNEAFWFQEGPGVRKWQFTNAGIKLLNVANITKQGMLDLSKTERHLSEAEVTERYCHFLADEGDLVIASSGISFDEDNLLRTRGAFVEKEHLPLCMNTSTIRFKAKENISSLKFLKFWLNSREFRTQITRYVTGSAQQNFGPSHLNLIEITLPPLDEQRYIAAVLDKADTLREKRRQAINKLYTLLQAVFLDMFGDPMKNPKGWVIKSVGDSVDLINGRAFKPSEWGKKGLPIVRIQNLKDPKGSFYNFFEGTCEDKYIVKPGDLLLSWAGQLVSFGVVVWTGPAGWLNQHIFRVVPKIPFELSYLEHALGYVIEQAKSKFHGIEMKHITKKDLVEYKLPYPPIEVQQQFASIVAKIESLKANQNKSIVQSENLFHSLQQRAFNGELFNGTATAGVLPQKTVTIKQPELFD